MLRVAPEEQRLVVSLPLASIPLSTIVPPGPLAILAEAPGLTELAGTSWTVLLAMISVVLLVAQLMKGAMAPAGKGKLIDPVPSELADLAKPPVRVLVGLV